MNATRDNATLVDLLDRILDKGVVIQADIIITVAGIPLIGINLRTALAGMETMVKYGFMREWDEQIRSCRPIAPTLASKAPSVIPEIVRNNPGT